MADIEFMKGVSPTLHSGVVSLMKGYEDHGGSLSSVVSALDKVYSDFGKVHQLKSDLVGIESLSEAQKCLKIDALGKKNYENAVGNILAQRGNVENRIEQLSKALTKSFQDTSTVMASEIRSHYKNSSPSDRRQGLMSAIESGDLLTVNSILGGPSYLSGLTNDEKNHYTRVFHEKNSPELSGELSFTKNVLTKLEAVSNILDQEYEKAIGADLGYVKKIREDDARATIAEAAAQ